MKTATLIAKGPSASKAKDIVGSNDYVAVINDAGKLIPGIEIDYMFFAHTTVFPMLDHLKGRLKQAVSRRMNPLQLDEMPDWIRERHKMFDDWDCDGDMDSLNGRLLAGGIMAHHTTSSAMHYLCKVEKFEKIKVVGVDGGLAYAEDLKKTPSFAVDLDLFLQIAKRVAIICSNVYQTEFEWYHYESNNTG